MEGDRVNRYRDDHKDVLLSALGSLRVSIWGLRSTGAHYRSAEGGGQEYKRLNVRLCQSLSPKEKTGYI